jgi:hypothetical protein
LRVSNSSKKLRQLSADVKRRGNDIWELTIAGGDIVDQSVFSREVCSLTDFTAR